MKIVVKIVKVLSGILLCGAIIGGAWVVFWHPELIKPERKPEDPEPVTDVAVQIVKIEKKTLYRYIECYGTVGPEQRRVGGNAQSASARIAAPVAGLVADVLCVVGQQVEKGAPLFQLDDRIARSEEAKADAALSSAKASLARLKASTRPEQIAVAEIALKKAKQSVEFAQQSDNRTQAMAKDQLASVKQLEDSAQQLAAAREDQTTAEKQVALLKNSPSPEELAEAAAKVVEAEKALAATHLLIPMLTIKSPLSGTVVKVNVNPGEPVDTTLVLSEIVDLKRLEVSALVPASEMNGLKTGQAVAIVGAGTDSSTDEKSDDAAENSTPAIKATLVAVSLQVDPKNDTVMVRAVLPADSGLKPGQAAKLKITVDEHRDCLVVPEECVFKDKDGVEVIAGIEDGKSVLHNVTPGFREKGLVELTGKEVKDGDIKEGGIVASAGAYGLPDLGTKVHVVGSAGGKK